MTGADSGGTLSRWRRCSSGTIGVAGQAVASAARPASSEGGGTLVIGKSFDLVTMDPGRMFETTGGIIVPAMYDTLLTFENNDVTEPMPGLADELGGQRRRHRVHVHAP